MLKKISAALLVASLITAPALAATATKTERAPVTKTVTTVKTIKPSVANAKAQAPTMKKHRHHRRMHVSHRHARKHMGAVVTKKVIVKRVSSVAPAKTIIVKSQSRQRNPVRGAAHRLATKA